MAQWWYVLCNWTIRLFWKPSTWQLSLPIPSFFSTFPTQPYFFHWDFRPTDSKLKHLTGLRFFILLFPVFLQLLASSVIIGGRIIHHPCQNSGNLHRCLGLLLIFSVSFLFLLLLAELMVGVLAFRFFAEVSLYFPKLSYFHLPLDFECWFFWPNITQWEDCWDLRQKGQYFLQIVGQREDLCENSGTTDALLLILDYED